jgi:hypothetical protein
MTTATTIGEIDEAKTLLSVSRNVPHLKLVQLRLSIGNIEQDHLGL